jgi:hypothetical protein
LKDENSENNENNELIEDVKTLKAQLDMELHSHNAQTTQTLLIHTDPKKKRQYEKVVGICAVETRINCLMCIDYFDMIGMNEYQKCNYIKKVYADASKAEQALMVINDINTIIGGYHNSISSSLLQTIVTLMRHYDNIKTIVSLSSDLDIEDRFDVVV